MAFTFDHEFKPHTDGLPSHLADRMAATFIARRPLGLNVQFIRHDGDRDEMSFATPDRVEAFVAKLVRTNTPHAVSH